MEISDLKNKPLVEAILEMKWRLESDGPSIARDPHYRILVGRLYDRVSDEYPEHEELTSAQIPDELSGQMVKHRFRHSSGGWPLLQIGPGILTLNETADYTWADFSRRAKAAVDKLYESHPKPSALVIDSLLLRYIDAVDFDYQSQSILGFLSEKMKVSMSLPGGLFAATGVGAIPVHLNWQCSFACGRPKGVVHLNFATGRRDNRRALLWETMVQSERGDVPDMPSGFDGWISAAHAVTHDWFSKLIEGDLERRFRGE